MSRRQINLHVGLGSLLKELILRRNVGKRKQCSSTEQSLHHTADSLGQGCAPAKSKVEAVKMQRASKRAPCPGAPWGGDGSGAPFRIPTPGMRTPGTGTSPLGCEYLVKTAVATPVMHV